MNWALLPLIVASLTCTAEAIAQVPGPADRQVVSGLCSAESHTAEGPIGSDLTKRQSRFFCDTAAIVFFPDRRGHVMVSFAEKRSHRGRILSFAGQLDPDGIMLQVDKVYFEAAQPTFVDDGACKFFFKGKHMSEVFCGTKIDEEERRNTAIISFEADPGQ